MGRTKDDNAYTAQPYREQSRKYSTQRAHATRGLDVEAVAVSPSVVAITTPVNTIPTTTRIVATVGRGSRGSTRAVAATSTKRRCGVGAACQQDGVHSGRGESRGMGRKRGRERGRERDTGCPCQTTAGERTTTPIVTRLRGRGLRSRTKRRFGGRQPEGECRGFGNLRTKRPPLRRDREVGRITVDSRWQRLHWGEDPCPTRIAHLVRKLCGPVAVPARCT